MRQNSQQANQHKAMAIMDVNQQAVIEVLQRHRATLLVHGHTHQPAIHPVPKSLRQLNAPYSVLGTMKDG